MWPQRHRSLGLFHKRLALKLESRELLAVVVKCIAEISHKTFFFLNKASRIYIYIYKFETPVSPLPKNLLYSTILRVPLAEASSHWPNHGAASLLLLGKQQHHGALPDSNGIASTLNSITTLATLYPWTVSKKVIFFSKPVPIHIHQR